MVRGVGVFLALFHGLAFASPYTPLEWQTPIKKNLNAALNGQRKHVGWTRDRNGNFIDDQLESLKAGTKVDVVLELNECMAPDKARSELGPYGKLRYVGKLVTFVVLDQVKAEDLKKLAAHPGVAMVEKKVALRTMGDVSVRAVKARESVTFPLSPAPLTGTGVRVAVLDTGVDETHNALAGTFREGFDATRYEDTNNNLIDDSCEPAPLGNGACTDADDEPGTGATNPADPDGHGTHAAGIILGRPVSGATCRSPNDGSTPVDCAGVARAADLVDVRVCAGSGPGQCDMAHVANGLDWLARRYAPFNSPTPSGLPRVVAYLGVSDCTSSDGTDALSRLVNYVASVGIPVVVPHGNTATCPTGTASCSTPTPGTAIQTGSPAAADFAITVGGFNDRGTITQDDDTFYSSLFRGPRNDPAPVPPYIVPNPVLRLKPDVTAPAEGVFAPRAGTANGYVAWSGTSVSAAHVAGAVAQIIQSRPNIDPGSIKDALISAANDRASNPLHTPFTGTMVVGKWNDTFGNGLLRVHDAVQLTAQADVGFPTCQIPGAPPVAGQPCPLTGGLPAWNNTVDITTRDPPRQGVANKLRATIRNHSGVGASVVVNFGVYEFGTGTAVFHPLGSRRVTVPATTTQTEEIDWTPAVGSHQCVQTSIDFGNDTNFGNNVTQRNINVAPSVYEVRVENPFMIPARIDVTVKSSRADWLCKLDDRDKSFVLEPFKDCPRKVKIAFNAPRNARIGEKAGCDLEVKATPLPQENKFALAAERKPAGARVLGGVTMVTFVPKPCRVVGTIADTKGRALANATLTFTPLTERGDKPVTLKSDEEGIFQGILIPEIRQKLSAVGKTGKGVIPEIKVDCGVGKLRLVLDQNKLAPRDDI